MTGSRALWLAALLGWTGCDSEIVLGDGQGASPPGSSVGSTGQPPRENPDPVPTGAPDPGPPQPPTGLPALGQLVWSATHEAGDLSEWQRGGEPFGGEYDWGEVAFDVAPDIGHLGGRGLRAFIDTSARGEPSQGVRFYRRTEATPAFYGAWFKLEDRHSVADWWSISVFYARPDASSLDDTLSLWDVRVIDTPDGGMALQFFDLESMRGELAELQGRVQPGEWFELTLYLDYRPPSDTRVGVLLNGVELFDIQHLRSSIETNVFWAVGNGAGDLSPAESTLYLDDAFIRRPASANP